MKICIVGASGKLGKYMIQHALDRGYEVTGVCRERSVSKLDAFKERIRIIPVLNALVGVFGLGQIIWLAWLGIVLLRSN